MNDILEFIHIIIEAGDDFAGWSNIKEFVNWGPHHCVKSFFVHDLQRGCNHKLIEILLAAAEECQQHNHCDDFS